MTGARLFGPIVAMLGVCGMGGMWGGRAALAGEPPGKRAVLVGVLTEQADMLCNGTFAPEWVRPHYEVGFVEVVPAPGLNLDPWLGKPVLVWGAVLERKIEPPAHTGQCPGEQMRSDYVRGRQGLRIKRPNDSRPQAFAVQSVETFDGLEARFIKGALFVKLTNRLGVPVAAPQIRVHYEGCYKKPLGLARGQARPALPPSKFFEARFEPWVVDPKVGPPGAEHAAAVVQVVGNGTGPVHFDLDLPFAKLGLQVECRNRL